MPAKYFDSSLKTGDVQCFLQGSFTLPRMAGRVAVLLLIFAGPAGIHRLAANDVDLLAFDFTADVFTPMGRSHFKGRMATDGTRHRIALYWAEPGRVRDDAESLITYCDILFSEESAYYWVHGSAETGVLRRSGPAKGPLVPQEADVQSLLCCVLRTVDSPRSISKQNVTPLHLHEFLRNSRLHPEYTYGYRPEEGDDTDLFRDSVTDRQVLNALPLGREYVKGLSDDGTLQWRLSKTLDSKPVIRVRIGDRIKPEEALGSRPFDANWGNGSLFRNLIGYIGLCGRAMPNSAAQRNPELEESMSAIASRATWTESRCRIRCVGPWRGCGLTWPW